jgi:tRNA1Val (adenine37-N6)-methyltransferase
LKRHSDKVGNPNPVQMALPPAEELSLDKLAGDWSIYQLKRGHRFSSDDMLTAWMGLVEVPDVPVQLDLGAGIGSVGLLSLYRRQETCRLVMLEAQEVSHALARKSVGHNGLQERVDLRLGDLRDYHSLLEPENYPLVTGSPPYFPVGTAVISPHPQRAACRMELRGSILDYAAAAAHSMTPDGAFVFCMAAEDPRSKQAIDQAGLHLHVRQHVLFRASKKPTITLFVARKKPSTTGVEQRAPLIIRDAQGVFTEAYQQVRRMLGFTPRDGSPSEKSRGEQHPPAPLPK